MISLVEGDYRHIGRAGTARIKVVVRRLAARFIDVFVANNPPAREYLIRTLNVPEDKIIVGWWLAGMPADLAARPLAAAPVPEGWPLFVCAGRLIPQKGTDLVIRALAVYRRQFGPCALWVIGEGPERESLVELSRRLGVEDMVTFLGTVDHQVLKGAFQACQAFVFPTLQDFDRPRRRRGAERGRAGGGVADDWGGRHDRARRRERDSRGPKGRVGAGRGDASRRRPGHVARSPRRRPANQRRPSPRGGRRGAAERGCAGAGRPRRTRCELDDRPGFTTAD